MRTREVRCRSDRGENLSAPWIVVKDDKRVNEKICVAIEYVPNAVIHVIYVTNPAEE